MAEVAVNRRLTEQAASGVTMREINFGRLSLQLGASDARYLRLDGVEFVRRIFAAVRDVDWGTAPMEAESTEVDVGTRLQAAATGRASAPEHGIELVWGTMLRSDADGTTEFSFSGTARRPFTFARVGLCVLHPTSFCGGSYAAKTADGWIEGALPKAIAPQLPGEHGFGEPLFPAFDELVLTDPDGVRVRLELSGDYFEFEDQRNWADASYKTYSTPLSLGPQTAAVGQTYEQRVLITPEIPRGLARPRASSAAELTVGSEAVGTVPSLGVLLGGEALSAETRTRLSELRPAHLRVDVSLESTSWRENLSDAFAMSRDLDVPVELAITLAAGATSLEQLRELIAALRPDVARVLVFRSGSKVTAAADVVLVRRTLAETVSAPIYGGTDTLFADLNAHYPDSADLDGVAFPVVPTVHADDDLSLIETMPVFGDIAVTAAGGVGDVPIAVSPITLRERPHADPRQRSALVGVWTLGTVAALSRASAHSATVFEAVGPRGVIEHSGGISPAYRVVEHLCGWRGRTVVASEVRDPLATTCLAVAADDRLEMLIGNALARTSTIRVEGLEGRRLDIRRLVDVADDPGRTAGERQLVGERHHEIELDPYGVVRVEVEV